MAERIVDIERLEHTIALFGNFDQNINLIENQYNVAIICRGTDIKVTGETENVDKAARAISALITILNKGESINDQNIRYVFSLVSDGSEDKVETLAQDCVCITSKGKPIKPKTLGQKRYIQALNDNTITLGIGPAGTGKTFLAVAAATKALRNKEISRIKFG